MRTFAGANGDGRERTFVGATTLDVPGTFASAAAGDEAGATASRRSEWWRRFRQALWIVIVALAGAKNLLAAGSIVAVFMSTGTLTRLPFIVNLMMFGVSGAILILGGPRDQRGRNLGVFFVFIASAFSNPFIPRFDTDAVGSLLTALGALHMDAFLPLSLWLFVRAFPSEPTVPRARRVADVFVVVSAAIGGLLFAANLLHTHRAAEGGAGPVATILQVLDRHAPTLIYWPLLFVVTTVALLYLGWKLRFETVEARQRGVLFVMALGAGVAPMLAAVILTPFVPALGDPAHRTVIGWVVYSGLLSVIPSTAYAVIVNRVIDVHFVLHKTSQHALARYAVWTASVGPLAYVFYDIYRVRRAGAPEALFILPLIGFTMLLFRERLLGHVDRWFLRGPVDYADALARVQHDLRDSRGVHAVAVSLVRVIERTLHPSRTAVLAVDDDRKQLVALEGTCPPLSTQSMMVEMLRQVRFGVQLTTEGDGRVARLLSPADRAWLAEGEFTLLWPLIDSADRLIGIVAIGDSRGGLPYTKQDRMFIAAICSHATVQLENRWLQESAGHGSLTPPPRMGGIDWDSEPGAQCLACWMVWPGNVRICTCEARTVPAALPFVIKGKFRVEQLIGSGGMGVVYQAVDMTLDRRVAIKTLPEVTPDRVALLQREARTMASVLHPNLALIFGAEQWRGTPVLIVEYLEGGTLSHYLRRRVLDIPEVIDLGVVLADVLDRVHAAGVLHRDIKPSNIAYTREGIVKLLDFGVAVIVDRSLADADVRLPSAREPNTLTQVIGPAGPRQTFANSTQHLVGTPLYLSPEALAGAPPGPSFDLWSLSLVLYESVAGIHPLNGDSVAEVVKKVQDTRIPDVRDFRADCPAELAALLSDSLSPRLDRRPATAREVRLRLQRLRASLNTGKT
jgi:hypothetical protein